MRYRRTRPVLQRASALIKELCIILHPGLVFMPSIILARFSCYMGNAIVEDYHPLHRAYDSSSA